MMDIKALELAHFLTDPINYKILKFLLQQHEAVSNREIGKRCKLKRTTAIQRVDNFVSMRLLEVHIATRKYETQKVRKDYMRIFFIRPRIRQKLNNFVDLIESKIIDG